jgi:phosphate transport system protein
MNEPAHAGPAGQRTAFGRELQAVETDVLELGALAEAALELAVDALATGERAAQERVVRGDDEIDRRYQALERRVLGVIARQAPVAGDLRLLAAVLHIGLHLERIGDAAVATARLTTPPSRQPPDQAVVDSLLEMGALAASMTGLAMRAFAGRDAELAAELPVIDDRLDSLNRGMADEVLRLEGAGQREWGLHMDQVARQLERAGDHAVDIGEQVWFLVTGELREFGDREGRAPTPGP